MVGCQRIAITCTAAATAARRRRDGGATAATAACVCVCVCVCVCARVGAKLNCIGKITAGRITALIHLCDCSLVYLFTNISIT